MAVDVEKASTPAPPREALSGDRNFARLRSLARVHALPLVVYGLLTLGLTWPTARDFTTRLVSSGGDARHNLWVMWHIKEAVLGREPLWYSYLLYYPVGISLHVHALGPLMGFVALPFWLLGPEAAYNSVLLLGLWVSGYTTYLLARTLGLEWGVALFAGVVVMSSEMILVGLWGHVEKTFVGLLPLVLLTLHNALDTRRSAWWTLGTAVTLLLTLLLSGWQFVLACLAVVFFVLASWWGAEPAERRVLNRRVGLLFAAAVVLVGPLLGVTAAAANNPDIIVEKSIESFNNQPDLLEFFVPNRISRSIGAQSTAFLTYYGVPWYIETTVSLSITGLILGLVSLLRRGRTARRWVYFTAMYVMLALGPTLKVLGRTQFTDYNLPIPLPYAFLTSLPGLGFMRKPGQFMLLGYVGFAIAASFGLAWLVKRMPRWRHLIIGLAVGLVLLEGWPKLWLQEELRPVPQFYREIAGDGESYGVFDLPTSPAPDYFIPSYASHYQMYQMTHRKGIAYGYLSRVYRKHPLFPCLLAASPTQPDVQVNGVLSNCHRNAEYILAQYNYRYVVWHKPQQSYPVYKPGSWGDSAARSFLESGFGDARPVADDDLVSVYQVASEAGATVREVTLELGDNWSYREAGWRWAASPATLRVLSPRRMEAVLEITPASLYDPRSANGAGSQGVLNISLDHGFSASVAMRSDETVHIPIPLSAGSNTVTLALEAGNFRPVDFGEGDSRLLSFSVRLLNLRVRR